MSASSSSAFRQARHCEGVAEAILARVRNPTLDAASMDQLRVVIADALVNAVLAGGSPASRSADALAGAAVSGPASVIGSPEGVGVEAAVLANSLRVHAILQDDSHPGTMLHPGAIVLPVALAVAQERGASTAQFLSAVVAGYEAMVLIAAPVAERAARRGLRNTTLFGPVGAAIAAGTIFGLDDRRLTAAILIASGAAGGTLAPLTLGSPEWRCQPGLAATSGLAAARLAAALDPEMLAAMRADTIEGSHGLYATLVGEDVDWAAALDAIGSPVLTGITHKLHSTCGANQVPVAALSRIMTRDGIEFSDISSVDVYLPPMSLDYPGTEDRGPFVGDGVYMSRPLALAALALGDGAALTRASFDAALVDSRLESAFAMITSHPLRPGDSMHPQAAKVVVSLKDGREVSADDSDIDPDILRPDLDAVLSKLTGRIATVAVDDFGAVIRALPHTTIDDLFAPLRATEGARA
ncbi:MmgE/PrpD family protein [Agromyces sp. NPDC049794]|uniref:MmgE/PrpD family protein n=1 Tax=unclassified Agromyces TaxID=2639701 RepID=UPI0034076A68